MTTTIDPQGRCAAHPFVQLKLLSNRTGEWKAILDLCPLCAMENSVKEELLPAEVTPLPLEQRVDRKKAREDEYSGRNEGAGKVDNGQRRSQSFQGRLRIRMNQRGSSAESPSSSPKVVSLESRRSYQSIRPTPKDASLEGCRSYHSRSPDRGDASLSSQRHGGRRRSKGHSATESGNVHRKDASRDSGRPRRSHSKSCESLQQKNTKPQGKEDLLRSWSAGISSDGRGSQDRAQPNTKEIQNGVSSRVIQEPMPKKQSSNQRPMHPDERSRTRAGELTPGPPPPRRNSVDGVGSALDVFPPPPPRSNSAGRGPSPSRGNSPGRFPFPFRNNSAGRGTSPTRGHSPGRCPFPFRSNSAGRGTSPSRGNSPGRYPFPFRSNSAGRSGRLSRPPPPPPRRASPARGNNVGGVGAGMDAYPPPPPRDNSAGRGVQDLVSQKQLEEEAKKMWKMSAQFEEQMRFEKKPSSDRTTKTENSDDITDAEVMNSTKILSALENNAFNLSTMIATAQFDSKGRCVRHPNVRLRKKKLLGGWRVRMTACPECCIEEMKRMWHVEENRRRMAESKEDSKRVWRGRRKGRGTSSPSPDANRQRRSSRGSRGERTERERFSGRRTSSPSPAASRSSRSSRGSGGERAEGGRSRSRGTSSPSPAASRSSRLSRDSGGERAERGQSNARDISSPSLDASCHSRSSLGSWGDRPERRRSSDRCDSSSSPDASRRSRSSRGSRRERAEWGWSSGRGPSSPSPAASRHSRSSCGSLGERMERGRSSDGSTSPPSPASGHRIKSSYGSAERGSGRGTSSPSPDDKSRRRSIRGSSRDSGEGLSGSSSNLCLGHTTLLNSASKLYSPSLDITSKKLRTPIPSLDSSDTTTSLTASSSGSLMRSLNGSFGGLMVPHARNGGARGPSCNTREKKGDPLEWTQQLPHQLSHGRGRSPAHQRMRSIHVRDMRWTDLEDGRTGTYTGEANYKMVPHGWGELGYDGGGTREGEWDEGWYCGRSSGSRSRSRDARHDGWRPSREQAWMTASNIDLGERET